MGGILRVRVAVLPSVKMSSSKTLLAPVKPLLPGMESEIYPWGQGPIQVARVDSRCSSWGIERFVSCTVLIDMFVVVVGKGGKSGCAGQGVYINRG